MTFIKRNINRSILPGKKPVHFLLLTICCLQIAGAQAQSNFNNLVRQYYRVDPFAGSYAGFVEAFQTDPELENKIIKPKTDTSLFSATGLYHEFNPFHFKPDSVRASLFEVKIPIRLPNNTVVFDTVMAYQITGFFTFNEKNLDYVQREFRQINKRLKNEFANQEEQDIAQPVNAVLKGALTNYFPKVALFSPFTVSWYLMSDNKTLVQTMVLRLAFQKNRAVLGGSLFTTRISPEVLKNAAN